MEAVVCLVVDECHRAVGKNEAAAVIARMRQERCRFRCLGLSATPGATKAAVQARATAAASPCPLGCSGPCPTQVLLNR